MSHSQASGSERSPLLPKAAVEHVERGEGEVVKPSDKPEKSQAMVMYVPFPGSGFWLMIRTALMVSMLLCGWNAGSLGPLLPALQSYYDVRPLCSVFILISRLATQRVGPLWSCGRNWS